MKNQLYYILLLLLALAGCNRPSDVQESKELPPIYPDYTDITIPCNIAPLNFLLRNEPQSVEVSVKGPNTEFVVYGNSKIQFPEKTWRTMLETEKGNSITVKVIAKVNGHWISYSSFKWKVSTDKIDPYLSYRRIEPGYEVWYKIQLCQRNLENFTEEVLADKPAFFRCHKSYIINRNFVLDYVKSDGGYLILKPKFEIPISSEKVNDFLENTTIVKR